MGKRLGSRALALLGHQLETSPGRHKAVKWKASLTEGTNNWGHQLTAFLPAEWQVLSRRESQVPAPPWLPQKVPFSFVI